MGDGETVEVFGMRLEVPQVVERSVPFFVVAILLEGAVFLAKRQLSRHYRVNDMSTSIMAGLVQQMLGRVCVDALDLMAYCYVYSHWALFRLPESTWWIHLLCFLAVDCSYYWLHRFTHECSLGWASHSPHHSSEDYNLSTALRQGALQGVFNPLFHTWMALLGFHPITFLTHSQINTVSQFWIHTESIKKVGILEYVLNTPSHHRVHHARNPRYLDKNYAGALIIWDRMFGTFQEEEEEPVYGLVSPIQSFDPTHVQFGYLQEIIGKACSLPTWRQRWRALFASPAVNPTDGSLYEIPEPPKPAEVVKFGPSIPPLMTALGCLQFLVLAVFAIPLVMASMPYSALLTFSLHWYLLMTVMGATFGGHWLSSPVLITLELLRLILTTLYPTYFVSRYVFPQSIHWIINPLYQLVSLSMLCLCLYQLLLLRRQRPQGKQD